MTADELKQEINQLGLTRHEAAEALGISSEHMRRLLSRTVDVREIYRLALEGLKVEMGKK